MSCPHFLGNMRNFVVPQDYCGVPNRHELMKNAESLIQQHRDTVRKNNNWNGDYMTLTPPPASSWEPHHTSGNLPGTPLPHQPAHGTSP